MGCVDGVGVGVTGGVLAVCAGGVGVLGVTIDASGNGGGAAPQAADPDGFMSLPDGIDEELPFN